GFADVALGFATGVVGRGSKVVQDDGCGAPEGDEAQQRGGGDQNTRNSITQAARCSRVLGRAAHYLEGLLACDFHARTFSGASLAGEVWGGGKACGVGFNKAVSGGTGCWISGRA